MKKSSRGISALCIAFGLLLILSLVAFNPFVIQKITGDLHAYYISNIQKSQLYIGILSIVLILLGVLGYKLNIFRFVDHSKKVANLFTAVILFLVAFLYIEFVLKIKPQLTTAEVYDSSVPYEQSIFSRNKLPQESINVPYHYLKDKKNYRLNQGYHGPKFSYQKPEGKIRVVVMGGSFIFGDHQVSEWKEIESEYDRNWIKRAQKKIDEKGYQQIELINAGVPGNATFDCLGRLYSEVHLFEPDYVILCNGWNDIKYFTKVTPENSLLRQYNPTPIKSRDELYDPLEISQVYLRIKRLFQFGERNIEGGTIEQPKIEEITPYALKQFELNIDLFTKACQAINAKPILLTQPRLISRKNTEKEKQRIRYDFQNLDHEGLCNAYEIVDSTVLGFSSKDTTVVTHDFAQPFTGVDSLFYDHVHLNANGSEVMSSYLATFIINLVKENN